MTNFNSFIDTSKFKVFFVNKDLNKGDIISKGDIEIKGPGGGVLPKYLDEAYYSR